MPLFEDTVLDIAESTMPCVTVIYISEECHLSKMQVLLHYHISVIYLYVNNTGGGVEVQRLKPGLTVFAVMCKCQFHASPPQAQIMYTAHLNYYYTIPSKMICNPHILP